jgi:DNA repair protein RadC
MEPAMKELQIKPKTYWIPRIRYSLVRESYVNSPIKRISNSKELVDFLHAELDDWDREVFLVLHLDTKNNILDIHQASIGSLSTSIVHPREIWCYAVRNQAAAVIFAHNHPSGSCEPSREDRECTSRLCEAGKILGIRCLDHIVLGFEDYYSFADAGLLQEST